ncbi:MAG: M14 family metallopeptidase [Candidatus Paceibacteria bacterium]
MTNTKILWVGIAVVAIIILLVVINFSSFSLFGPSNNELTPIDNDQNFVETPMTDNEQIEIEEARPAVEVIGQSADGNDISAYTFGTGTKEILLISGIHGGYSWNTSQLAYELIDHLEGTQDNLEDVRVTVIPVLNPDGLDTTFGTTGRLNSNLVSAIPSDTVPGRFNGNSVDINRNFDCQWQASGVWQNRTVSGGSTAFSEPEAQAIRAYIEKYRPTAAIVYYSAAGGVYASNCNNGVSSGTQALLRDYGTAAGYTVHESYDYYATTGDMANWLARENIPTISVLLTNHTNTEFTKNRAGLMAVIETHSDVE